MQISNQRKINGTPINILNGQVIQKSQAAVNRCSLTQCQTAKKSCQRSNGPDSRHYLSHQCVTYTSHIPPTVHLLSPSFFLDGTRRRLRKRHPCNLPNNVISDISCLLCLRWTTRNGGAVRRRPTRKLHIACISQRVQTRPFDQFRSRITN